MLGLLVPAFRRASLAGLKAAATLLLFALPASAVCHVVTPAGAGLRDGSTWDNAFGGLPATLVRGDVYYIATANYTGGYRFNTPESGTTVITIKKATPTDHCTETGWQASFGVGQAVWDISNGGTFQFTDNGYWVFDGQYRSGLKSGHGFKINWGTKGLGTSNTLYAVNVVGCASGPPCTPQLRNITVRYLEIAGGGVNGTTDDSFAISSISRNAAGTQATVVTSSNARYIADNQPTVVGSLIAVSGVADASFNTTSARVIATSDQTHFTYANVGTANATSSGGTLTGGLGGLFEFDFRYTGTLDGLTLEYSYIHDSSDTPLQNDGRPSNTTIQYNVFARNTSSGNHHSEGFADQHSNNAGSIDPNGRTNVRYNFFEDIEGTGFIVSVGTGPTNRMEVYGNVFMWHQGNPYRRSGIGNGIIATTSNSVANNWLVYNNSFINTGDSTGGASGTVFSTANRAGGAGFTAYNNLCYFPTGKNCSYSMQASEMVHDWTMCITIGMCTSETSIQTGSSNPFVDWVNENYHLLAATQAGNTLSAPYNTDPDANTRGASGVWNRGAYEFVAGAPTISSVTLNPASVVGGNASTGTVTISSAAPSGGSVVTLSSNNTGVATVPASVTVPQGQTTATFTGTTTAVSSITLVTITATLGGSATATLTNNPPGLSALIGGTINLAGTVVIQ